MEVEKLRDRSGEEKEKERRKKKTKKKKKPTSTVEIGEFQRVVIWDCGVLICIGLDFLFLIFFI